MLALAEMAAQFRADPNKEYRVLVGFEWELLLFERGTLKPLRYHGERGLGAILEFVARREGAKLAAGSPPNKLPLPDGGQISVEPGGQFEFSSAPSPTFSGCMSQLRAFEQLVADVCSTFEVQAFYGGATPVHTVDEIGLVVPNERYSIMNEYFPRVGARGRKMMRQTTSVQVTFDYRDREIGTELFRTALHLAPLAAAIFAHAPYIDGADTGYRSYRGPIWADTDPARCGLLPGFEREDYSFLDYVAHVVEAPMFFVKTDEGVVDAGGMTFAQFNREGFRGRQATIDDFLLHNSTIFTDARLKNTVELRSIDGQDPTMVPAVLAFLSGLLLCNTMRPRTLRRLEALQLDFGRLAEELPRDGLSGKIAGMPARELACELLESARGGVATCFPDGEQGVAHLDPVIELAQQGLTPADVVREEYGDPRVWLAAGRTFSP